MKEIKNRRSVRSYKDTPVPDETLRQLLESARLAPSGSNTQPARYIVVKSPEMREKVMQAAHHQKWMLTAPIFIVCVADIRARIGEGTAVSLDENSPQNDLKQIIRDTAIAAEHIVLEAQAQGLGTCWIAWFEQKDIRPVLDIPEDKYVVSILTVGYPDEAPAPRSRKTLEELVRFEKW